MPIYEYRCSCGKFFERFLKVADYQLPVECSCGQTAEKQLSAPAVITDYPGYECPVSGKWIEGRKAHQENLARTGCRVLETGEFEGNLRKKEAAEASFNHLVDSTVEQALSALPARKMEKLAAEVAGGIDLAVKRQTVSQPEG